jgi:hypothetical protein
MGFERNDFALDVALGKVSGWDYLHKFGRNPAIDTADGFQAIWQGGGDYTGFECTVASTLNISSNVTADKGGLLSSGTATNGSKITIEDTSATFVSDGVSVGDMVIIDTQSVHGIVRSLTETEITVYRWDKFAGRTVAKVVAGDIYRVATATGTGAGVIHLQHCLDNNLENQSDEYVILDGTTVVTTTGEYRRQARGAVIITGSGGANAATITSVQSVTSTNIMMQLPTGYNKSMICAYTVPFNVKSAHLSSFFASIAGKTAATSNIRLLVRHIGEAFEVYEEYSINSAGAGHIQREYKIPKDGLSPGCDIKVMADTNANDTAISSGLDLLIRQ